MQVTGCVRLGMISTILHGKCLVWDWEVVTNVSKSDGISHESGMVLRALLAVVCWVLIMNSITEEETEIQGGGSDLLKVTELAGSSQDLHMICACWSHALRAGPSVLLPTPSLLSSVSQRPRMERKGLGVVSGAGVLHVLTMGSSPFSHPPCPSSPLHGAHSEFMATERIQAPPGVKEELDSMLKNQKALQQQRLQHLRSIWYTGRGPWEGTSGGPWGRQAQSLALTFLLRCPPDGVSVPAQPRCS